MRKLAWLLAAAGLLTGLALYVGKAPTASPEAMTPGLDKKAVAPPKPPARHVEETKSAGSDLSPGRAEIPYDPELPEVNSLREEEVESEITRIDERLARENWAERANRGELKPAELLKLRGLLHHRNRLFERKLDLAGL